MKIFYRGVSYEYDPSKGGSGKQGWKRFHIPQTTLNRIWRGVTYLITPKAEPSEETDHKLVYRGVTYSVTKHAHAEGTTVAQQASTMELENLSVPDVLTREDISRMCRRIHQANMLHSLHHRLTVARRRSDRNLVKLLEAELQQITTSIDIPQR